MSRRGAVVVVLALAACEADYPKHPPPGSCAPGERVCYFEPNSKRELALRCNEGEVANAIWLIDDVCVDGEICESGACVQ